METKFVEKLLKKDLIKQGQKLEKEMLVLQEQNRALVARNKNLYEDLEQERAKGAKLKIKDEAQEKEIVELNTKIRGLEGKVVDMTNDWTTDNESANKQIQVLTAELKAANTLCDNRATSINALKAENANLTKANNRGNYINLFLGGVVLFLFMYICWRM